MLPRFLGGSTGSTVVALTENDENQLTVGDAKYTYNVGVLPLFAYIKRRNSNNAKSQQAARFVCVLQHTKRMKNHGFFIFSKIDYN